MSLNRSSIKIVDCKFTARLDLSKWTIDSVFFHLTPRAHDFIDQKQFDRNKRPEENKIELIKLWARKKTQDGEIDVSQSRCPKWGNAQMAQVFQSQYQDRQDLAKYKKCYSILGHRCRDNNINILSWPLTASSKQSIKAVCASRPEFVARVFGMTSNASANA